MIWPALIFVYLHFRVGDNLLDIPDKDESEYDIENMILHENIQCWSILEQ